MYCEYIIKHSCGCKSTTTRHCGQITPPDPPPTIPISTLCSQCVANERTYLTEEQEELTPYVHELMIRKPLSITLPTIQAAMEKASRSGFLTEIPILSSPSLYYLQCAYVMIETEMRRKRLSYHGAEGKETRIADLLSGKTSVEQQAMERNVLSFIGQVLCGNLIASTHQRFLNSQVKDKAEIANADSSIQPISESKPVARICEICLIPIGERDEHLGAGEIAVIEKLCTLEPCCHSFGDQCVRLWLTTEQSTCPTCRAEVERAITWAREPIGSMDDIQHLKALETLERVKHSDPVEFVERVVGEHEDFHWVEPAWMRIMREQYNIYEVSS
ncbi:RING/U-box [Glarea lozoyensis ATCC 20868]|uniref:RING/U-box n=1 Tax=Glarea lozoyensis (strain ATCC 20868 / MF5171) TaxID=1116229 RepID=S3DRG4_GLAL2|nr:RING/U-box [Glarea lozoyensis ATCC 20868]EPE29068.1 RING/U-box [Glarea lozoyensis ATCC 20868]